MKNAITALLFDYLFDGYRCYLTRLLLVLEKNACKAIATSLAFVTYNSKSVEVFKNLYFVNYAIFEGFQKLYIIQIMNVYECNGTNIFMR